MQLDVLPEKLYAFNLNLAKRVVLVLESSESVTADDFHRRKYARITFESPLSSTEPSLAGLKKAIH